MRLDLVELLASGDRIELLKQMSIDDIFVFSIHRNRKPEIVYCDIPFEIMNKFCVVFVNEFGGKLEFYGYWKSDCNEDILKWATQDDMHSIFVQKF